MSYLSLQAHFAGHTILLTLEMVIIQLLHTSAGIVPTRFVFSRDKDFNLVNFAKPSTGKAPERLLLFANLKAIIKILNESIKSFIH